MEQTIDEFCMERLSDFNKKEALTWVNEGIEEGDERTLGELETEESKELVEELYELGALKIYAVEITNYEDGDATTDSVVVELPKEEEKRRNLFERIGRNAQEQGFDPDEDQGQQYLFMHW